MIDVGRIHKAQLFQLTKKGRIKARPPSMQCPSSSTCTSFPFTPRSSLPNKVKKQRIQRQQRQRHHHSHQSTRTSKFFPRTRPTPLLLSNKKPQIKTKLEALDAVVDDLEASVKRGIDVMDTQMLCTLLETFFNMDAVEHGIRVHRLIPPKILRKNVGVASKLVRLYAFNGLIEEAHEVFDGMSKRDESAFVWNSLISGYAELGQYEDALALYFQMEEVGVELDRFTFPRALKACSGIGLVQVGEEIHRHVVRYGFHGDVFVLNALVAMYAKCGDIVKARRVFDKISIKDLVSWNSMITGYFHHGLLQEAMSIFRRMLEAGLDPDEVSVSSILKGVSSVRIGGQIHGWILRHGLERILTINNALISFYSYHGKLEQARWLFSHMAEKDVGSWNSIISADPNNALIYFQQMQDNDVVPDSITFLSLLSACGNLGFVRDGDRLFLLMREKYGIVPSMEHYACMVNLYGRAGLIDKAYEIVTRRRRMEFEAGSSSTMWGALLYTCCLHGNADIGEIAAKKLFELEPDNEHNYQLLMKIYEGLGRFGDVEMVRKMMADRGLDSSLMYR